MIEPTLLSQRAYDAATSGTDTRAIDLIVAIGQISEASLALAHTDIAGFLRDYECPAANPLNQESVA